MNIVLQKLWSFITPIFTILSIGYGGLCVIVYLFQSRMLYFPAEKILFTPHDYGFDYEEVYFTTEDNVKLHGWFIPVPESRGAILFHHGNAGNIGDRLDSITQFRKLGYSVFIFDYRGYGKSNGYPDEQGTYIDAVAAWSYLTENKNIEAQDIIIFGRSLGGSIASWLARKVHPRALIIESTFTSALDMAQAHYGFLPVKWLLKFEYDTKNHLQKVTSPVLIIHSPQDNIVPYRFGEELFRIANEPKDFLKISGSHNDGFLVSGDVYINGLKDFLNNLNIRK
ncbi:alpha/beta fold hydrolase [candidate division KSB1 bacterium]|nr:alpha/beta fold hydrolase [candidate division KSB1 bacterium]